MCFFLFFYFVVFIGRPKTEITEHNELLGEQHNLQLPQLPIFQRFICFSHLHSSQQAHSHFYIHMCMDIHTDVHTFIYMRLFVQFRNACDGCFTDSDSNGRNVYRVQLAMTFSHTVKQVGLKFGKYYYKPFLNFSKQFYYKILNFVYLNFFTNFLY